MTIHLSDITAPAPSPDSLAAEHAAIDALLDNGQLQAALAQWDQQRRDYATWVALAQLRFQQDTADETAKAVRERADELGPVATGHEIAIKRRLLDSADRKALEAAVTPQVVRLWEADVTTFDPIIAARLEEENKLTAAYTELTASARLQIRGQEVNLSGLQPFAENLDREIRREAAQAEWQFFQQNGEKLDGIYGQLVQLRTSMAGDLGYENFIELGYKRMRRTDYDAADVARYRDEIVRTVVPLLSRLMERRRRSQGWDTLYAWDEPLIDPKGNPAPQGDHDTLVAAGQELFDRMDGRLGGFFKLMNEGGFLDLKTRPSKAPGGFCDAFPSVGMPVIFANFNGTYQDISVFTHEMGHALQVYESRNIGSLDTLWPTTEACEIHSMSLEMLSYPHMGLLVGDDAVERFQRMHLEGFLTLLVDCALGDHFQHEVYANPQATPAERHAIYRQLERRYLPWRNYGDIAYAEMGATWQRVLHYFLVPFYYIDYALACCCALQFWVAARRDPKAALERYLALCAKGGSASFLALLESADLASPFEPGVLSAVVKEAEAILG
jgi:M3 family oligoendopeptidase